MSRIRHRGLFFVFPVALAATVLLVSCLSDPSGPSYQAGYFALAPNFESSAAGIVDVESIHVVLVRDEDETVALDTVVALTTDAETVDLSFSVLVSSSSETFTLTLECLSPTGEVVFRAGPMEVTATTSGGEDVVAETVVLDYVGTGYDAAGVRIVTTDVIVDFGEAASLVAEALDSSGAVIEGTPIEWVSHDTDRAVIPDRGVGQVVGGVERGWVHVEAKSLTGQADTIDVMVEPVPNAIRISSGDAQTGPALEQLRYPLVVEVTAVDGLGVEDVQVEFSTNDGGSFGQATVTTDAEGFASTTWTLGSGDGSQTATATVTDIAQVAFSATATPEVFFQDDFEDADLSGWICYNRSPGETDGQFVEENGVLTITGQDNTGLKVCLAGDPAWTDYALEATVNILGGVDANGAYLLFRVDPDTREGYYFNIAERDQLAVITGAGPDPMAVKPFSLQTGTTYDLRVEVYGSTITAFVNGRAEFQINDSEFAAGQIGLATVESETIFDDVRVTVVGPPPTVPQLSFTAQPSNADAGAAITPAIVVTALDEFGTADMDFTGNVSIAIANNPASGTLSGTTTVAAVSGVATFDDLSVDLAGTGYTLEATAAGYASATSIAFDVSSAPTGAAINWTGTGDGTLWSDALNWDLGRIPSSLDTVNITQDASTVVELWEAATVAYLYVGDAANVQTQGLYMYGGHALQVDSATLVAESGYIEANVVTLSGAGTVTVRGDYICEACRMDGPGSINIEAGAFLSLADGELGAGVLENRLITNDGTIEWLGGNFVLDNGFQIVNNNNLTITAVNAITWGSAGLEPQIINNGTVTTSSTNSIGVDFVNNGTLDVQANTITFAADFSHADAAVLQGSGTIDLSNVTAVPQFDGDVNPGTSPGILTFIGDALPSALSTANIEIGGLTVGTEYDQAVITGDFTADGAVDVSIINGFTPTLGDRFTVLTFASRTGDFATYNGLVLGGGLELQPQWNATSLELEVVSQPLQGNSWTGGAGDGLWSSAGNWSLGRIPNATDTVLITLDGTYTVAVDAPTTVYALEVGGGTGAQTVSVGSSRTLTVDSAATFGTNGILALSGGTVDGLGNVDVNGSMSWTSGFLNISGTTTVGSGATFTMTGGGTKYFYNGTLNNSGDIVWDGGTLTSAGDATLNNLADGTMAMQGALTFSRSSGAGVFNNAGTLTKTGTGTSNISMLFDNATTGTVSIMEDTLRFSRDATLAGDLSIPAGATLYMYSNVHTIDTSLVGAGSFQFAGGANVTVNGTYSLPHLVASNGTVVFNGPVTATDSVVVSGGNVTFNDVLNTPPFLRFTSGTIAGSTDITVVDSLIWSGGFLSTTGTTTIASGQLLTMTGGGTKYFYNGTLNNSGDIVWDGGTLTSAGDATLNNLADGTMAMQGALTFSRSSGAGVFNNAGTLTKTGTGTSNISMLFDNATTGTVSIMEDTLRFSRDATLAGDLSIPAGATLYMYSNVHTIDTSLVGAGSFQFAGGANVTVNGTYSLPHLVASNGTVVFNGPVTATDSVVVSGGNVTFNDVLNTPPFLRFTSGTIAGSTDITVVDSLIWSGGFLSTTGTTTIASGQLLTMTGGGTKYFYNGTLNNSGDIVWDGGTLTSAGDATLNNLADGTMAMQGALTFSRSSGAGVFNNAGTLTKTGTGTSNISMPFDNATTGTVSIMEDTLRFSRDATLAGDLSIPAGATLYMYSNVHTIDTSLVGAGSFQFAGGANVTVNGTYSLPHLVASNGTVVFNGPVTATDSVVVSGGNVTFNDVLNTPPFLRFTSGTIAGSTDITVVDSLIWSGGFLSTTGTTTIASGQLLTMTGGGTKYFYNGTLNNSGDIVWDGGTLTSAGDATLNNLADGTMAMQGALTFSRSSGAGVFNNAGTLTKTGAGTSAVSMPLGNAGTIDVQMGTLDLNSTFTHEDNAILQGIGTLDISGTAATLEGDIEPGGDGTPGILTITGDVDLTANSAVNIDIIAAGYDQLAISGSLTIAGTLNLDRGTYDPTIPTMFPVITYSSFMDGPFNPINGTGPYSTWQFTTFANTTQYEVTASAWP